MENVRVGFIGAGGLANMAHYPSVRDIDDAEIVGICDLKEDRLRKTADRYGIDKTFLSYQKMLDETQPDAVYAIMPPYILYDVAMDVLQRGHNIFIEKPPGVTTFQTANLAKMAEKKGVTTAVGFQRRYHPMVRECHARTLEHGDIQQVTASFYKNMPPREVYPYYRGAADILRCDVIHAVDSLRYYCGLSELREIQSTVRSLDCSYDCSFHALLHFENDAVGILQANWRSGRRFFRFEFHALGACAFGEIDGGGSVYADDERNAVFETQFEKACDSAEIHVNQGFLAENRAFIDGVRQSRQVHNSLQDAVKTMELCDLILDSGR